MEEKTEEEIEIEEENEVYNEAKIFLEEVKKIILEAVKMNKKVEYKSENLLILSLVDNLHGVFEVYNMDNGATSAVIIGSIDKYMDFFHALPYILFFIIVIYMIVAAIRKEGESGYR